MIRLTVILFSLFLSLPASAAEPVFDVSSWDRYSESSGQLSELAIGKESLELQQALNSYAAGIFLPEGEKRLFDGMKQKKGFDFEQMKKDYLKNLAVLDGLTLHELLDRYDADLRAKGLR